MVGSSGAGKSTLARRLAELHGARLVELDAIHWAPGWVEIPDAEMRARVADAIAGPAWVVDGNYAQVRDLVWARVDLVVWLDLPFPLVLWRIVTRTLRRTLTGEPVCNGNRERFVTSFFSRESVIWWAITTFRRRRAGYERLAADPASPPIVRLRSTREVEAWLAARTMPAPS